MELKVKRISEIIQRKGMALKLVGEVEWRGAIIVIDTAYTVRNDGKNFVNSSSLYWVFPQLDISEISILKDVIYFCVELVKSQVRRHKELT